MGCDGGTIPTRDELVKLKKKPEKKDKVSELAAKWRSCAISQEALRKPIVSCEMGKLYNKESVLELLLDKEKFEGASSFDHIRGLKDVKELQLTDNPALKNPSGKGDAYTDNLIGEYICPVVGLEMNGRYRFSFLWKCGCVFSERALKEVKSEVCHKCGKTFQEEDIIVLNPEVEIEAYDIRKKLEAKRIQAKLDKKAKKKKAEAAVGSAEEATTSKQPKLDTGASTSKANGILDQKSKLTNGASRSKVVNGRVDDKKGKSIQQDPKASKAFKDLFTTSSRAQNQPKAHWVTYNPCFN